MTLLIIIIKAIIPYYKQHYFKNLKSKNTQLIIRKTTLYLYQHTASVDQSTYSKIVYNDRQYHRPTPTNHDDGATMLSLSPQPHDRYRFVPVTMTAYSIRIDDYHCHQMLNIDYLVTISSHILLVDGPPIVSQ